MLVNLYSFFLLSSSDVFLFLLYFFFFFNDTATTEIYTLSLHDALPILIKSFVCQPFAKYPLTISATGPAVLAHLSKEDRKSTRLNSSHLGISYAVFCLKKKKNQRKYTANILLEC